MKVIQFVIVVVFLGFAGFAGHVCAHSYDWLKTPEIRRVAQPPSEFSRIVNAAEHIAVSFHKWEQTDFK